MSGIRGMEGVSGDELMDEIDRGGKFVVFDYTISIVVMTFRRSSGVQFIKAGEGTFFKGLPYSLITFIFGWWGIPWGPIYSIGSMFTNFSGGRNVSGEVLSVLLSAQE